jgi:recombination protein RecT
MSTKLTIRDRISSEAFTSEIAKVLPKHITPERMARAAATAINRTPLLAECDQASFFLAMMSLSQWGLEPDGRNAHLIPFRNNKKGIVECQLIIDYKGLVELIERSGLVSKIHADKVCENDDFVYDCGDVRRHAIDFRKPRGAVFAYYAIIEKKDGSRKCEVMSVDEVSDIRKRSRSANNGPWVTDFDEMAKKTVFKRASKWVSLSAEIREAIQHDDKDYVIDAPSRPTQTNAALMAAIQSPPEAPIENAIVSVEIDDTEYQDAES